MRRKLSIAESIGQVNAYEDGGIEVADGKNVSHGIYLIDIDGKTIKMLIK